MLHGLVSLELTTLLTTLSNSRVLLQVCVSPSFRDVNETLCSLKFGLRAMKVHNVAQINVEVRVTLVHKI